MADRYKVTFIRAWRIVDTMAQVMVEEHLNCSSLQDACIIKVLNWFISEEIVNMEPTRCTTTGTLYCAAKRSNPSHRAMVASSILFKNCWVSLQNRKALQDQM